MILSKHKSHISFCFWEFIIAFRRKNIQPAFFDHKILLHLTTAYVFNIFPHFLQPWARMAFAYAFPSSLTLISLTSYISWMCHSFWFFLIVTTWSVNLCVSSGSLRVFLKGITCEGINGKEAKELRDHPYSNGGSPLRE